MWTIQSSLFPLPISVFNAQVASHIRLLRLEALNKAEAEAMEKDSPEEPKAAGETNATEEPKAEAATTATVQQQ